MREEILLIRDVNASSAAIVEPQLHYAADGLPQSRESPRVDGLITLPTPGDCLVAKGNRRMPLP